MWLCEWCGGRLPIAARADAKFCSGAHRVAAHRALVPVVLRERDRWVRRSAKRPVTVSGRPASSTNPKTWSSFAAARASTAGDGLGFVLNGDGIVCVDLDHCLIDGVPTAECAALLEKLPRTYIEVSPGGDGLHVWGFAAVEHGRMGVRDGQRVEVYGSGRYMTITGKRFGRSPLRLADLSECLGEVMPV